MAKPQNAGVLPRLSGRCRASVSRIRRHASSQGNLNDNYRSRFTMPRLLTYKTAHLQDRSLPPLHPAANIGQMRRSNPPVEKRFQTAE
jgi:hypothetical protein